MTTRSGNSENKRERNEVAPIPRAATEAPAGAFLGTRADGTKVVADGNGATGTLKSLGTGDNVGTIPLAPAAALSRGETPAPSLSTPTITENGNNGKGNDAIDTTVKQPGAPAAGNPDVSTPLAADINERRGKAPYRSNNFTTIIGAAGGLGRKTNAAKRSLIGGA